MDLEELVGSLKEELKSGGGGDAILRADAGATDGVPRPFQKAELIGHRAPVTRVLFHPRFSVVITASEDACIKVWDSDTGEVERTLRGHTNAVQDLAVSNSGMLLASCSADFTLRLWDMQNYDCLKTLQGHEHTVSSVAFTPPSKGQEEALLSASRDTTIKVWDPKTGSVI
jgi:platelet-activating factor acetylhydrolase IB subunit alpha